MPLPTNSANKIATLDVVLISGLRTDAGPFMGTLNAKYEFPKN
jgi:hypothetical protein